MSIIFNGVGKNGEIMVLVTESLERHYRTSAIPITSLCVIDYNDSCCILEWKELDTRFYGIFKLSNGLPLSCLIIQISWQGDAPKISMKWVVERIQHLHYLLQIAQTKLGASTWRTQAPRLIFP